MDTYLLPVPEANIDAYRRQAETFGSAGRAATASSSPIDPQQRMTVEDGVVLTTAVVESASRAHRDEVMAGVMSDPRVEALVDGAQIADMSRMSLRRVRAARHRLSAPVASSRDGAPPAGLPGRDPRAS